MALETRFSLAEIHRLNTLPTVRRPQDGPMKTSEARELTRLGWLPMALKRWPEPTIWDMCVDEQHPVAFHFHDGRWFYRHGEAICAIADPQGTDVMTDEETAEMGEWLDAIHAHEART